MIIIIGQCETQVWYEFFFIKFKGLQIMQFSIKKIKKNKKNKTEGVRVHIAVKEIRIPEEFTQLTIFC